MPEAFSWLSKSLLQTSSAPLDLAGPVLPRNDLLSYSTVQFALDMFSSSSWKVSPQTCEISAPHPVMEEACGSCSHVSAPASYRKSNSRAWWRDTRSAWFVILQKGMLCCKDRAESGLCRDFQAGLCSVVVLSTPLWGQTSATCTPVSRAHLVHICVWQAPALTQWEPWLWAAPRNACPGPPRHLHRWQLWLWQNVWNLQSQGPDSHLCTSLLISTTE